MYVWWQVGLHRRPDVCLDERHQRQRRLHPRWRSETRKLGPPHARPLRHQRLRHPGLRSLRGLQSCQVEPSFFKLSYLFELSETRR